MAAPGFSRRHRNGEKKERIKVSKEGWRTARKMFSYLRPYRGTYLAGMVFLVLSTITTLGFPYILGQMVNTASGKQDWFLGQIDQIALLLLAIVVAQMIFSFLRVYTFSIVTQKAMADIRKDLYSKLLYLPILFFEKRRVGELTSRITADVQQLQNVLSTTLAEFFRQIFSLIGGVAIILATTPKLALFMLMIFPPLVLVGVFFGRFIRKHSKNTQNDLAATNVVLEESLHNISIVKAFTNELFELNRYRTALAKVVRNAIRTDTARGFLISFVIFALFGSFVAVIWYGGHMVIDGEIAIGDLFSFILYMAFIGGSLGGLPDIYAQILKAVGATEHLKEILDEPSETDSSGDKSVDITKLKGEVRYENVRFSYPTRPETEVLQDISLHISAGQKIALAGSSGAGKSTIAQLLMRFYDLTEGTITIDGKPLRDYPISALRQLIGVVPQEVILFGGSIKENIAYGRLDASEAEIRDAAKKANALDFIEKFPEGFETVVGERGIKLSGGQRQRLAIARAILKDPVILVLDEATSSLDAESEKLVQDALDKLMENRTTLMIAHRLGTIRHVDRIYVLSAGEVVESGTHQALVAKENGVYSNLVKLQMLPN
ncbi:MAG TPA: ATP-binding cassette domain-containing protein [Bacteroidetes bacterium]|nr:ATP-binding cassette domain-containing protein [Bacteroidota bacterium]